MKNIQLAYAHFVHQLQTIYQLQEAESITNLLFKEFFLIKPHQIKIIQKDIGEADTAALNDVLERLLNHEPIQYILGYAWFYNYKFRVNNNVLIPRNETEELVDLVLKKSSDKQSLSDKNLQVIDIGTGSGCIAISLKLTKPNWKVFALDVSKNALALAKQNASELNANIAWIEDDILNINNPETKQYFDIIISNPPYIKKEEKANMDKNVVEFEPSSALFVNDHQPIVFYEAIANFALKYLNPGGFLFFEINQMFGKEVTSLLSSKLFINIELHKDINGNDRMVSCVKPTKKKPFYPFKKNTHLCLT